MSLAPPPSPPAGFSPARRPHRPWERLRGLYKNAALLSIADAAAKGASGVLALIVARYFGPALYGEYAIASSVSGLFLIATGIGFEQEFTRRGGMDRSEVPRSMGLNFMAIALTGLVAYLGIVLLASFGPYSIETSRLILLMGMALIVHRFHFPFRHFCLILQKSKVTALVQGAVTLALLGLTLGLIAAGGKLTSVVWAHLAAGVAGLVLWSLWMPRGLSASFRASWRELAGFFRGSLPFAMVNMVWIAYFNADTFILSLLRPAGEVGLYAGIYRIIGINYILGYAVANTFTPLLFEKYSRDRQDFRGVAGQLLATVCAISLPLSLGLYFYSGPIVGFLIGDKYLSGVFIAKILSLSVFFRLLSFGLCEILTTSNRQKTRVLLEVSLLALNVTLNYLLIKRYGGVGAAMATLASESLLCAGALAICLRARLFTWRRRHAPAAAGARRICLDLRYKTESGSSSYIKNVVPEILRQDRENSYVFVKYPGQSFDFEREARAVVVSPRGSDILQMLWTVFVLPFKLKRLGVDAYHAMKMPGPYWNPVPHMNTMHSIVGEYKGSYPGSWKSRLFIALYAKRMIRRSDRLVAVSEFVKEFLVEKYRIDPARIDVIYHGIDAETFRPLEREELGPRLTRRGCNGGYVLCVGNIFPVKNHLAAVRAFAETAGEFPSVRLVIAGGTHDPYFSRVREEVRRLGLEDRVSFPGFVRGRELAALMNGARAMLFPSLIEGCPVTLLEALRCGLPVIASRRGGLWDLGRECCLFVDDPLDHRGFAEQLRRVLASPELREELRRKSLAKSEGFTWAKAAAAHVRAYRRLTAGALAEPGPVLAWEAALPGAVPGGDAVP